MPRRYHRHSIFTMHGDPPLRVGALVDAPASGYRRSTRQSRALWAGYGSPSHGPAVGALVVWRHHVGIITGRTESGWVVKSGNDGRAVRERERSVRGAIAFRWPNAWASAR